MNPFSRRSQDGKLVVMPRRDSPWNDMFNAVPIVLFARGLLALWKGRSRTPAVRETAKRGPASGLNA
jgi:hypothetical protein